MQNVHRISELGHAPDAVKMLFFPIRAGPHVPRSLVNLVRDHAMHIFDQSSSIAKRIVHARHLDACRPRHPRRKQPPEHEPAV